MTFIEPNPNLRPGTLFCERYRIERVLDEGGMATVYLAVDESSGLPVAIKVLFSHYSDNTVIRARFLDEGRIQAMLNHPNIVHVYRVITDPFLCFVMEYVDGGSLEEYLQQQGTLLETEIIDLILPVMSAVGFAHQKGIIHRDIKPSNVLLKQSSGYLEPKVMDFGVAKIKPAVGRQLTAAGTTVGTLHYMSPEQIVGASNIDGRADIYSLGCTLYKLCTGEVPFNAGSEFALMMAQVEAPPTPPRQLRADLSSELEEVILTALAKEPENRFQTIKEMTSALVRIPGPGEERDTDTHTRPIPASLLEFAMGADEIALDQTSQYRLEHLQGDIHVRETLDLDATDNRTHELSQAAVKQIERDRAKAAERKSLQTSTLSRPALDDETHETDIEELTTSPISMNRDAELRTTVERQQKVYPERDAQKNTPPEPAVDETTDLPTRIRTVRGMSRNSSQGILAVNKAGVDSQEVTNQRIPQAELRKAFQRTQKGMPSQRGVSEAGSFAARKTSQLLHPHIERDEEEKTNQQRPSQLLRPNLERDEEEKTDQQRPSQLLRPNLERNEEEKTSQQRPSQLLAGTSSPSSPPSAADPRPASAPELSPENAFPEPASQASKLVDDDQKRAVPGSRQTIKHVESTARGRLWLALGAVALFLALLVLVLAIVLR